MTASIDKKSALAALWAAVEAAARAMTSRTLGAYGWGDSDDAMRDASGDDLYSWVDDVCDRMDFDETHFRAAIMDYTLIRDGAPEGMAATDYAAAIAELGQLDDSADVRAVCLEIAECQVEFWTAVAALPDGTGADQDKAAAWGLAISDMEDAA